MTRSRFVATASSSPERNEDLERRWSDDLPAMAPAQFGRLALVHRGEGAVRPLLLLQQPARPGRSIEKQHPPGFRAAVLPGMRHTAGHEGAGAGAADIFHTEPCPGSTTMPCASIASSSIRSQLWLSPRETSSQIRRTLAMSRRATASEAPLLDGRLDRVVRRHVWG